MDIEISNIVDHGNFVIQYDTNIDCKGIIEYFDYMEDLQKTALRPINQSTRRDSQLFLHELDNDFVMNDRRTNRVYHDWNRLNYMALDHYFDNFYHVGHRALQTNYCKIQKTKPGQGFHDWHQEHDGANPYRWLAVTLYLNEGPEGGETEFLYQSLRVKPKEGSFLIFPAFWTHAHRGNPPINWTKYIVTSWVEEFPDVRNQRQ